MGEVMVINIDFKTMLTVYQSDDNAIKWYKLINKMEIRKLAVSIVAKIGEDKNSNLDRRGYFP